jgi:hypothetical protein
MNYRIAAHEADQGTILYHGQLIHIATGQQW